MRDECPYCADLDKYNLDPAKPVTFPTYYFSPGGQKEITKNRHKERNGVSFCVGVECYNEVPVTEPIPAKKKSPRSHETKTL